MSTVFIYSLYRNSQINSNICVGKYRQITKYTMSLNNVERLFASHLLKASNDVDRITKLYSVNFFNFFINKYNTENPKSTEMINIKL